MLGINKVLERDVICDDMMTYSEGSGHLNVEDAEGIKLACSGHAKRNPEARRFMVT